MIINYVIENRDLEGCYLNGQLLLSGTTVKLQDLKKILSDAKLDASLVSTSKTEFVNATTDGAFELPTTVEELLAITSPVVEEVA